jgi:hypothetical protein
LGPWWKTRVLFPTEAGHRDLLSGPPLPSVHRGSFPAVSAAYYCPPLTRTAVTLTMRLRSLISGLILRRNDTGHVESLFPYHFIYYFLQFPFVRCSVCNKPNDNFILYPGRTQYKNNSIKLTSTRHNCTSAPCILTGINWYSGINRLLVIRTGVLGLPLRQHFQGECCSLWSAIAGLLLRLRIRGTIPPLPETFLWRAA